HAGVGGRHAHLGDEVFAVAAGAVGVDDEGADAAAAFGIGEDDDGRGDAGVGDQVLAAVENEVVAAALVGHLHFERVAARFRLGEAECQDVVAATGGGQIAFFLLLVAPRENRVLANRRVAGEEGADAGPLLADACQGAGVRDSVGAAAAVSGRDRHA